MVRLETPRTLGHFLNVHAREESHLDDLRLAGIELGELLHGFIKGQDLLIPLGSEGDGFIEFHASGSTAALLPFSLPGVIDQDSPDRLRPHGKKMGSALPIDARLIDQPQIRLVNQGGWLKRMVGPLMAEMPGRQRPKFIIDQRHELGRRRRAVAIFQAGQKLGDFGCSQRFVRRQKTPIHDYPPPINRPQVYL